MVVITRGNGEVHLINESEFMRIVFIPKEKMLETSPCRTEYTTTYLYGVISVSYNGQTFSTEPDKEPVEEHHNEDFLQEPVRNALFNEIDRIDREQKNKKAEKYPYCRVQRSGIAMRFIRACHYNDIETVGQLLDMGRDRFLQFRNIGNNCASIVSQALMNLYGVKF